MSKFETSNIQDRMKLHTFEMRHILLSFELSVIIFSLCNNHYFIIDIVSTGRFFLFS